MAHSFSPFFPQSNGEVERAVQTVRGLLKKAVDPSLALMAYRVTPLANGHSPEELLMGRRTRTLVPVVPTQPSWPDLQKLRPREQTSRLNQWMNLNRGHRACELPPLGPGDHVWIKDTKEKQLYVRSRGRPGPTCLTHLEELCKGTW